MDAEALGGALAVGVRIWRARGCPDCRQEGYKGRLGLYEVVEVDERLQALIHDGASELELGQAARLSHFSWEITGEPPVPRRTSKLERFS